MQKINICHIVALHLTSLRDGGGRIMISDILVFFVLPFLASLGSYFLGVIVPKDAVSLSVTVLSIFSALLLSVQVALYSVSLRPMQPPEDLKKKTAFENIRKSRDKLIKELNDNISYLILVSVFFITLLLGVSVMAMFDRLSSSVILGVYVHFILTLLMVVKRASVVLSREYENQSNGSKKRWRVISPIVTPSLSQRNRLKI